MTDWTAVVSDDFPVPDDLDAAVDELVGLLASPDPTSRDELAFAVLSTWVRRGVLDDRLVALGDTMATRLGHPRVQARAFAPLILAAAVERDTESGVLGGPAPVRRWRDAFTGWWPAEREIRGWDDTLGWLHVVAHGADLVGALGASPRMSAAELSGLLRLVAERAVADTGYRYAHQEEDRLALAVGTIVRRPELAASQATGWLAVVDRLFDTGEPGPVPVPAVNTLAMLRATYVMVDRLPVPHRVAVTDAVARRLHEAFPPYPIARPAPPSPAR